MTATPDHGKFDYSLQGIHTPFQWHYANAGARTGATGFVATDVGKMAWQTDNDTVWMLTATTPTWVQVGGAGGAPGGAAGGDLTGTYPNPTVDIDGKTGKTTPVDADETFLADSAATFATKKLTWANLKATLKTYNDTLYAALTHATRHQNGGADEIATATPAANAIPKADANSKLDAWITAPLVKLASVASVDLNSATAQTLYTVPAGKSCIVAYEVVRNASTSLTTASWSSGFNSAAYNDVIADAAHTELTGSTLYTILAAKIGAKVGAAADVLKLLPNTLQGGAATVTVDVFGYLF